jgi:hypothetical protein
MTSYRANVVNPLADAVAAFGPFKRSTVGSFHQISVKHLDRYLDEFEFRYNNRTNAYLLRDGSLRLTKSSALPYDKLTA